MASRVIFLMVMVLAVTEVVLSTGLSANDLTSITFKKAQKNVNTSNLVFGMEVDLRARDNNTILFSDFKSIKTMTNNQTTVVATNFTGVVSFKQLNTTHIVVVDGTAHCLKMLIRADNSRSVLAGQCGTPGFSDGKPGLFRKPAKVIEDETDSEKLIVSDWSNHALRTVNISTGEVSTLLNLTTTFPTSLAWYNGRLLVATSSWITEVTMPTGSAPASARTLVGSTTNRGYVDGAFDSARFTVVFDITKLADDLYLVLEHSDAASGPGIIRLLNMAKQEVQPVCTEGESLCRDSTNQNLTSHWSKTLYTVFAAPNAVYVSGYQRIVKLCRVRHSFLLSLCSSN